MCRPRCRRCHRSWRLSTKVRRDGNSGRDEGRFTFSHLFLFCLFPSPSCVCPSERLWKLYLNHWIRQATRLDALARLPACPPGAAAQHFDQHRRHYSLLVAAFFNQNNYRGNGIATATASVTANVQATGGSGTSSSDVPLATSEPVDPAAYLVPALAAGA